MPSARTRQISLGSWDLTDLVKDPSGEEFRRFLDSIESLVKEFEKGRQILQPGISPQEFERIIHLKEDLAEKISIASGYAHLRYYADTSSNEASALVTKMEMLASEIGNRTLFFDLWFKKGIDEENARRLINSVPAVYKNYLRRAT